MIVTVDAVQLAEELADAKYKDRNTVAWTATYDYYFEMITNLAHIK
jgi:hypothetical protein